MELFYREYGDSDKTLIILHGMLGMSDNWVHFARKLSDDYRVIVPDIRNHGRSPHDEKFNYRVMARDIYELTEKLNVSTAALAGHSMGGKAAMQYAADYPDRVSELIVLDMSPREYSLKDFKQSGKINHKKLLQDLSTLNLQQFASRQQITDYFDNIAQAEQIKYFLQKNIKKSNSGGFEFRFNPENLLKNMSEIIKKPAFGSQVFKNPVLFVKGEKSDYIKASDEQEILKIYPQAALKTIAGAGHIIHAEKPAELMSLILEFLGDS